MLFNSLEFFLFFGVVLALTVGLPPGRRWWVLLPASYFFYMSWNAKYAFLIFTSTIVDYWVALRIAASDEPRRRRALLAASLAVNLGLLFTFKYANFALESAEVLLGALGLRFHAPVLDLLLPVGISFYTFQTLSYTIDVYRGVTRPERHFGHFALFVSFFPQLVAGPIERARTLLPQLRAPRGFEWARAIEGAQLILWGLFKKLVVADRCGLFVDSIYANPALHQGPQLVFAVYLFAFQIYCDFSGYSDIAIGTARIFGVDLTTNFRQPFFAKTIPEFWRRWHITLLTWLRDYVYLPLAFRRKDVLWSYFSMMVLMTVSGLWHGAAWTFVLWGVLHGVLLCLSRLTLRTRDRVYEALSVPAPVVATVRTLITFHLFCLSMVFFRAQEIGDVGRVFGRLHTGWADPGDVPWLAVVACAMLMAIEFVQVAAPGPLSRFLQPWPVRWAAAYAGVLIIVLFGVDQAVQFIYFQF